MRIAYLLVLFMCTLVCPLNWSFLKNVAPEGFSGFTGRRHFFFPKYLSVISISTRAGGISIFTFKIDVFILLKNAKLI